MEQSNCQCGKSKTGEPKREDARLGIGEKISLLLVLLLSSLTVLRWNLFQQSMLAVVSRS